MSSPLTIRIFSYLNFSIFCDLLILSGHVTSFIVKCDFWYLQFLLVLRNFLWKKVNLLGEFKYMMSVLLDEVSGILRRSSDQIVEVKVSVSGTSNTVRLGDFRQFSTVRICRFLFSPGREFWIIGKSCLKSIQLVSSLKSLNFSYF